MYTNDNEMKRQAGIEAKREYQRQYQRQYRKKHPDKVRAWTEKYWQNRAAKEHQTVDG